MNAIAPPKEMPPDYSTAVSGTLPTEQTNERRAMNGPTMTFSIVRTLLVFRRGSSETLVSAPAHEPSDGGHQLLGLLGLVVFARADDTVLGVVVEQSGLSRSSLVAE